jgi:hypothetical protein
LDGSGVRFEQGGFFVWVEDSDSDRNLTEDWMHEGCTVESQRNNGHGGIIVNFGTKGHRIDCCGYEREGVVEFSVSLWTKVGIQKKNRWDIDSWSRWGIDS